MAASPGIFATCVPPPLSRGCQAFGAAELAPLDLTIGPTVSGFGTPGVPFALPPCGPFGWWVAVASDPYSRGLMSRAGFPPKPDSRTVGTFLESVLGSVDARLRIRGADVPSAVHLGYVDLTSGGCSSRSVTCHRSSTRRCTINSRWLLSWWRESSNSVSGKSGAVQPRGVG